jgi:hypothetical protein
MQRTLGGKQNEVEVARVAPTSRLAGPLRSQDRPGIGRGDPSADGLRVFVGRIHERRCIGHPPWRLRRVGLNKS